MAPATAGAVVVAMAAAAALVEGVEGGEEVAAVPLRLGGLWGAAAAATRAPAGGGSAPTRVVGVLRQPRQRAMRAAPRDRSRSRAVATMPSAEGCEKGRAPAVPPGT